VPVLIAPRLPPLFLVASSSEYSLANSLKVANLSSAAFNLEMI